LDNLNSQIIAPEYYNENTSLVDDIDFLSDSKNNIDEQVIANITVKYIFCYYYLDSVNIKIPFSELINFFDEINRVATIKMSSDEIFNNLSNIN
jgi:hypothetical protein